LLDLTDLLQRLKSLVKDISHCVDDILWLCGVLWLLVFSKNELHLEQWHKWLWSTHLLDLSSSVDNILNIVGVSNLDLSWNEALDRDYELLNGLLGHIKESVLHDELGLTQKLLEFSDLIHLFRGLVEVEPGLSDDTGLLEVHLDDLLDLVYPSLSQVVGGLRNR
jgi:hypothetical protein